MIQEGHFRKDLYFRLGVIKVLVPALNERPDDIIPLTKYFLQEFSQKFGKKFRGISPEAETILLAHNWTGHVRELKNIVERAVLVGKGSEITVQDLGLQSQRQKDTLISAETASVFPAIPREGVDLSEQIRNFERHYIEEALKIAKGNESKAAKLLNMNHHTYRYRRKKLLTV
jgi:transcriptional regulator with PAS, ATPase and Fis domain